MSAETGRPDPAPKTKSRSKWIDRVEDVPHEPGKLDCRRCGGRAIQCPCGRGVIHHVESDPAWIHCDASCEQKQKPKLWLVK